MPLNLNGKKLAVVGSRTFADKARLYDILTKNYDRIKLIISGGADGADTLAVEWAKDYGVPYLVFPAAWRDPFTGAYDRGAGFRRNRYIVDHADVVMAFWDGESKGTEHTIKMAQEANKPMKIYRFAPETDLQRWFKTKDSYCCSSPICEHQEWPKKIEAALMALMGQDDAALEKACGTSIDKIRPVMELVEKHVEIAEAAAEAQLGEAPEVKAHREAIEFYESEHQAPQPIVTHSAPSDTSETL